MLHAGPEPPVTTVEHRGIEYVPLTAFKRPPARGEIWPLAGPGVRILGSGGIMRVVVDLAVCQGYAQCAFLAPDAFRLNGTEGLMYQPNPSDDLRRAVLRAVAACPVQAIATDAAVPAPADAAVPAARAGDAR